MDERSLRALFLSAIRTASAGAVLVSCSAPEPITLSPVNNASTSPGAALVVANSPTQKDALTIETSPDLPVIPTGLANTPMDCSKLQLRLALLDGTSLHLDYLQIIEPNTFKFGTLCSSAKNKPLCEEEHRRSQVKLEKELGEQPYESYFENAQIIVTAQDKLSTFKVSDLRLGKIESATEAALQLALGQTIPENRISWGQCPDRFGETSEGYLLFYGSDYNFDEVFVTFDGKLKHLTEKRTAGLGRCPEGLCAPARREPQSAGEFFAEAAWLEAVSVPAFRTLARNLTLLKAPSTLIEAALAAAQDELLHEQQMTALAQREGESVVVPPVEEVPPKDLLALALENEREGCVNETFAALLAWHQAENAQDPTVASELKKIAWDETRHAALAFQIREWLLPQLTPAQQEATRQVRQQAIAARGAKPLELPTETAQRLGWPSRQQSLALLKLVAAPLWS